MSRRALLARFLADYQSRFEKDSGFLRQIIKKIVELYVERGNPRSGCPRIRSPMISAIK